MASLTDLTDRVERRRALEVSPDLLRKSLNRLTVAEQLPLV